jgi:hypothetical protein
MFSSFMPNPFWFGLNLFKGSPLYKECLYGPLPRKLDCGGARLWVSTTRSSDTSSPFAGRHVRLSLALSASPSVQRLPSPASSAGGALTRRVHLPNHADLAMRPQFKGNIVFDR